MIKGCPGSLSMFLVCFCFPVSIIMVSATQAMKCIPQCLLQLGIAQYITVLVGHQSQTHMYMPPSHFTNIPRSDLYLVPQLHT